MHLSQTQNNSPQFTFFTLQCQDPFKFQLPLSSNSVKLSLGKVEHEAGEKGSFSL
ncbi:hypothetical protein HanOQP8_Chr12g0430071 [Helianthus annuus]|nr:hypothetical protein HanOQP8_Chr12g0430071 [Helianthus annuus]